MIYSLRGTLARTEPGAVVVECAGVGYRCLTTANTLRALPSVGKDVFLYTYLNVREDALDLFGFAEEAEASCFRMLIGVSGVGPKAAIAVLSQTTPDRFAFAVASGDAKALAKAPGVGIKTAQRIVLDLKDKVGAFAPAGAAEETGAAPLPKGAPEEAVNALLVLGYSSAEAMGAVGKLDASLPVEELIRQALRQLARR